jgi:hypothetical protein
LRVNANAFAWMALLSWPIVVLSVYGARRHRARLARTTAWMMLLPVMFLPSSMTVGIGALGKHRIALLSIALALQIFHRNELLARARWQNFPRIILAFMVVGAFMTVRTNSDVLTFGTRVLPSLTIRDATWMAYSFFIDMYLPFAIGQRVFKNERDLRDLFDVLSLCAMVYVPLCLFELRFSPQLHSWVYGFMPSDFIQALRGTGYRPIVFMNHGLGVAMFLFSSLCAALALARGRAATRPSPALRAGVTAVILLLSRNMGSIIYAFFAGLSQYLLSAKAIGRLVTLLGVFVLAYPVIRSSGIVPTREIAEFFGKINPERQASLQFRFDNEDALLARANQRPILGWGSWGRNRIYEWWGEAGEEGAGSADVSVTDGTWIILLGSFGFVGFAGFFSLLVVPLVRFWRNSVKLQPNLLPLLQGLALMVAVFMVDLLPNSSSDFLPVAYAGALFTLSDRLRYQARTPSLRANMPGPTRHPKMALLDVNPGSGAGKRRRPGGG